MESLYVHKDYPHLSTVITYSQKDNLLYGVVEGLRGTVIAEISSVDEIEKVIGDTIKTYLEECELEGTEP